MVWELFSDIISIGKNKRAISYIDHVIATLIFILFLFVFIALLRRYFIAERGPHEAITYRSIELVKKLGTEKIYTIPVKIESEKNIPLYPMEVRLTRSLNIKKVWVTYQNQELETELVEDAEDYTVIWISDIENSTNIFMLNFIKSGDISTRTTESDITVDGDTIKNTEIELHMDNHGKLIELNVFELSQIDFSSDIILEKDGISYRLENATDISKNIETHILYTDYIYQGKINNIPFRRIYRLYKGSSFIRIFTEIECPADYSCYTDYSYKK